MTWGSVNAVLNGGAAVNLSNYGALVRNADGSWSFTPDANDDTSVSFSYSIGDGTTTVDGSATLDLTPVNDAPVLTVTLSNSFTEDAAGNAVGSVVATYTTADEENSPVTVTLSDTVNYALDGQGNVTLTAEGLALVNSGQALPSFTLTPSDGTVSGTAATVDPAVTVANDAPKIKVTATNYITEDDSAHAVGAVVASFTTARFSPAPTERIIPSGGLMIEANCRMPIMPRLETQNVPPVKSSNAMLLTIHANQTPG